MSRILFVLRSIWNWVVVMFEALVRDAYMSTRISANEMMGWKTKDNRALSFVRATRVKEVLGLKKNENLRKIIFFRS